MPRARVKNPPQTILDQMYRRMHEEDQQSLDQFLANRFGAMIQGGMLNAGLLFGTLPAANVNAVSLKVKNTSGGAMVKGDVVVATGSSSGVVTVSKARANADGTMPGLAILTTALADTAEGTALRLGTLTGIDTSAWSVGDELYVSSATAGALTNVSPSSRAQAVATVTVDHATAGELQVNFGHDYTLVSHDHTATAGDGGILTNDQHDGYIDIAQISSPGFPAADKIRLSVEDVNGLDAIHFRDNPYGVVVQVGTQVWTLCLNDSGSSIGAGSPVRLTGLSSGLITIAAANASSAANARGTFGIMGGTTTPNNTKCWVLTKGYLAANYATNAGTVGDPVFMTNSGTLGPTPGTIVMEMGKIVTVHATLGQVYIDPHPYTVPPHDHTNTTGDGGQLDGGIVGTFLNWLSQASGSEPGTPGTAGATNAWFETSGTGSLTALYAKDSGGRKWPIDQSLNLRVFNSSGSTIVALACVAVTGEVASSEDQFPLVTLVDADANLRHYGLTPRSIANNNYGRVVTHGLIEDVDTSAWTVGDLLYMSSTPGIVTSTIPAVGSNRYPVARVLSDHATLGKVWVYGHSWVEPHTHLNATFEGGALAELPVANLADGDALALLRTASDGVTVEWASAGQIVFPATQNASADANTLDDYEEGTTTITFAGNVTAGTVTYTSQSLYYTKNGRWVNYTLALGLATKSGSVGVSTFASLPFTPASTGYIGMAEVVGTTLTGGYTWFTWELRSGTTTSFIVQNGSGANAAFLDVGGVTGTASWFGSGGVHV